MQKILRLLLCFMVLLHFTTTTHALMDISADSNLNHTAGLNSAPTTIFNGHPTTIFDDPPASIFDGPSHSYLTQMMLI